MEAQLCHFDTYTGPDVGVTYMAQYTDARITHHAGPMAVFDDRYEDGLVVLEEAERAAQAENAISDLAHINYLRGNLCFPLGRIDECLRANERTLEYAREAGSARTEIGCG